MSELDQDVARARVLRVLQSHAPHAVSSWDLIHETQHSRAVGRIWELVKEGYDIRKEHLGRNRYAWRYVEQTARQVGLF